MKTNVIKLLPFAVLAATLSLTASAQTVPANPKESKPIFLEMNAQNGSQKSGWADIAPLGTNKTRVRVSISRDMHDPNPALNNPVNIYAGTCSDMGGIVYKLNNLKDGSSTTDLDVKFESFKPGPNGTRPLTVSVSWSADQTDKSLSCGDFEAGTGGS